MKTELSSISKIFTERILRIPDYQRGYAWTDKQLKDFWNDLAQLDESKSHYTGVLTLEDVPEETAKGWSEDFWIIHSKGYAPFYVVDGQQRLTTTIVLIQAITESIPNGSRINYTTVDEIRKKFIFDSKDDGISRSYIFGYEKDNPSHEFLKTRIFLEKSDNSFPIQETIYTHNLERAKFFFAEKLRSLSFDDIESLYRKLTQNFLFNIYSISNDVDVYVAFETMNNRGKPLSHLELLKNRLIYLSTKFEAPNYEKQQLRYAVNESWKSVYHYLGKNKDNPLDDDLFLHTHFILYFGEELKNKGRAYKAFRPVPNRLYRSGYNHFLLEEKFTPKNLAKSASTSHSCSLSIPEVYSYVQSLKESVEIWYALLNPQDSKLSEEEIEWLKKLNRIGFISVAPLIMVFYQREQNSKSRIKLLKAIERYLFLRLLLARRYYLPIEFESGDLFDLASKLSKNDIQPERVIRDIEQAAESLATDQRMLERTIFEFGNSGYYAWDGIRYFLYEYEVYLKDKSKAYRDKIDWNEFAGKRNIEGEDSRDYITIEHVYPQRPRKECWVDKYQGYSERERSKLRHSLGNLLALSKPKNSSFQNQCFEDKKGKSDSTIGFKYGSYSENEVSSDTDWTAKEILKRGLKLLNFMENRWSINLGKPKDKIRMLGLDFVDQKEIARTR